MTKKIRVGIICGGRSGEHDVSLMSADFVLAALDRERYEPVVIAISRDGQWFTGEGALQALRSGTLDGLRPALLPAGSTNRTLLTLDGEARPLADGPLDVVFPVLHGTFGEDGTVQGLLELANLPYVGAGVVGSAVAMDKAVFKQVMEAHGLPVLPWRLVLRSAWRHDPAAQIALLERALHYPMFTKPANLGSSVGISRCDDRAGLLAGLAEAAAYDRRIVVEQGVAARELEVAVLGNDDPVASVVGEIRPKRTFYDYTAKYISDDSDLLIPAPLTPQQAQAVRDLAVQVFRAIDCAGLGRVDFLLEQGSGRLFVNELNSIPGFTRISMYPKLWEASGLAPEALLDRLIGLALERFSENSDRRFSVLAESISTEL